MKDEITQGQAATMEIEAQDVEGMKFTTDGSQFIQITLLRPDGKVYTKTSKAFRECTLSALSKCFVIDFSPVRDLVASGKYKVYVSKVFGFEVGQNFTAGSAQMSLPTKDRPHILMVRSTLVKTITGAVLGVLSVCAIILVGYYAKQNVRPCMLGTMKRMNVGAAWEDRCSSDKRPYERGESSTVAISTPHCQ